MRWIFITTLLTLLATGCHDKDSSLPRGRGMYYWNTTFAIDSAKRDFIDSHKVERLYMRFFDVAPGLMATPSPTLQSTLATLWPIAPCGGAHHLHPKRLHEAARRLARPKAP